MTIGSKSASEQAAKTESAPESAPASASPSLGQRLKIRSMVTMAGEVLPFFWPMRNFIHHNPLHGLEHLPFEQAVAEASRLFHARGWLRRTEYQRLLAEGDIDLGTLEALVSDQVDAWLRDNGAEPEREPKQQPKQDRNQDPVRNPTSEYSTLLKRLLIAMLTSLDQPAPGDRTPCAEEVLACLRNPTP
ncbi:MAG: hypothetical protein C1943_00485 [Halochromatium sp.]|nr:hypothetical protein [Halochromatium sp.]